MPSASPETNAPPSNVTEARKPGKRKRETTASRLSAKSSRTSTPHAYARRSPPQGPAPIADDDEGDRSPPRKLKRPGAGARIGAAERQAAEAAKRRREEEERRAVSERQTTAAGLVAEHYNAVPERGREWRKTDSQIKGLRSLNNWVKSTLIQKFSRPDIPVQRLFVLDMACGKGGDLGKWEKAPQVPALYVGCDIADVSIEQARQRYSETFRRNQGRHRRAVQMQAEFYVQDTFGRSLTEVPMVRQVGFNPNAGPGGIIQGGMMTGGFDVVSMMFALHYSFESEDLARGMLKNVAGALKKGGRFIGVMPNSDVITATVKRLLQAEAGTGKTPNGNADRSPTEKEGGEDGEVREDGDEDDWNPEKPSELDAAADEDDWDPEKPSEAPPTANNGTADDEDDDWDPEKPSEPATTTTTDPTPSTDQSQQNGASMTAQQQPTSEDRTTQHPPLEWGNAIYTVRFPRSQPLTKRPLPKDGIFRPPYGWRYHYQLEEAVDVPEYVVPWEGFRALAEDYGLELMYRKGFKEVLDEVMEGEGGGDRELGMLAERMGVMSRDRSQGRDGLLVGEEEMEAAGFYHAFCFYKI